jgi:hypothetical protein
MEMIIRIEAGVVTHIHHDDLDFEGRRETKRASHVEPYFDEEHGAERWAVDLSPVGLELHNKNGFEKRADALKYEVEVLSIWLQR